MKSGPITRHNACVGEECVEVKVLHVNQRTQPRHLIPAHPWLLVPKRKSSPVRSSLSTSFSLIRLLATTKKHQNEFGRAAKLQPLIQSPPPHCCSPSARHRTLGLNPAPPVMKDRKKYSYRNPLVSGVIDGKRKLQRYHWANHQNTSLRIF